VHNWSNSNINITCTDILYNTCNYEKVNSDILYLVCINCGVDHGGSRGGTPPKNLGQGESNVICPLPTFGLYF